MNTRTGALIALTLGYGLIALMAACSEDKAATPAPTADDAGDGDAVAADTGANDSQVAADSPFAPDSGPPDSGTCTTSQPLFASGFAASCATCLAPACCAQIRACEAIDDCRTFAQCFAACLGDGGAQGACTSTCIAGKDGGAIQSAYNQLVLCGGSNCNNDGGASAPQCPF